MSLLVSVLPALLLAVGTTAHNVVYSKSGVRATAYYDIAHLDACVYENGGPWPSQWYQTINNGYTSCQGSDTTTHTLTSLNNNRIVAMDLNTDGKGPEYWCGKEVQIFDKDGKQIVLDEGPFVVYDNCGACGGGGIIDMSAKAFVQLSNGKCGDNPEGLTVKILDRNVTPHGKPGNGAGSPPAAGTTTASSLATTSTMAPTTIKSSTTVQSSSATRFPATTAKQITTSTKATATRFSSKAARTSKSTPTKSTSARRCSTTAKGTTKKSTTTSSTGPARITDSTLPGNNKGFLANVPMTCEFGKYECDGATLRICNYVAWNQLGWQAITMCPSVCRLVNNGHLECR